MNDGAERISSARCPFNKRVCVSWEPGLAIRCPKSRRRLGLPAEAQPIPDQAAARLGGQRNVSDEFGAAASTLQHDLATVECLELGPVPDADDREGTALPGQKPRPGCLAVG